MFLLYYNQDVWSAYDVKYHAKTVAQGKYWGLTSMHLHHKMLNCTLQRALITVKCQSGLENECGQSAMQTSNQNQLFPPHMSTWLKPIALFSQKTLPSAIISDQSAIHAHLTWFWTLSHLLVHVFQILGRKVQCQHLKVACFHRTGKDELKKWIKHRQLWLFFKNNVCVAVSVSVS